MQYKTKKELIYQKLRQEILSGQYGFGEKLVISRLAKRFDSSEIPIREAMNQLEAEKLIEFKPHTGAIVSTLSPKDIQDIFELRVELEGLATRLAADMLMEENLNELRDILDESKRSFNLNEYDRFEELNMEFHLKIYSKSDNQLLYRTIKDLWSNTNRYPSLFKENDHHIQQSIEEHEKIFAALANKDGMLAENWMIIHKVRAGKEILRVKQLDFYNKLNVLLEENNIS